MTGARAEGLVLKFPAATCGQADVSKTGFSPKNTQLDFQSVWLDWFSDSALAVCLSACLPACLSVCLSVCLWFMTTGSSVLLSVVLPASVFLL